MFKICEIEEFELVSERDFVRANRFLAMNPRSWVSGFGPKWERLLKSFDIQLENFSVTPEKTYKLKDGSNYCFYVDEIEGYFSVPEQSKSIFDELLPIGPLNHNHVLKSVAVEYFLRKFLHDIVLHWKGKEPLVIKFVGLDTQATLERQEFEQFNFEFYLNKKSVSFSAFIPNWIVENLGKEFAINSLIDTISTDLEENFLLSFVLCSVPIPTSSLIDVLKKDAIIELPLKSLGESVNVIVNNSQVITSRLLRFDTKLFVELLAQSKQNEIEVKRHQSLLTVSLGSRQYDVDYLRDYPRMIEIDDSIFPQVDIMVSNEIVSKGVLGFSESAGTFAVKVI